MEYKGEVTIEIYDQVSHQPTPVTTSTVSVYIDNQNDHLQSLVVAALEQALEVVKIAIRYNKGHI